MPYDIVVGRDASDKKDFGKKGTIFLGKGYVRMGQRTSLSNSILMDVVRSHVVLVAGKRGCLTEDTMVFTNKGYKKIKEFNEKEDRVLSFDKEDRKFEWEKADLLEYTIEKERLFQIELKDGRRLNLTKEHPLLSSYGKYIYYRKACDLKVGDKIVLPTKIPEIEKDEESLRIARLLGYILADGTINIREGRFKDGKGYWYNGKKTRIRINNACEEILNQSKQDLEKEFNIIAKREKRNDCNCEIIETKHQKVINKFLELGVPRGLKSHLIRVPKIVFESSNEFKAEFISALFDCDGYVDPNCKTIDYSSKSRKFLEDLQILLSHFDVESVIRNKESTCNKKTYENYRLFITDNTSLENFKEIGFKNPFKQKRLNIHKEYETRKRKTYYPSKNLVCVRIKSIKEISGIKKVYDLTVNKNHSFLANGIISHNSGKSYTLGVMAEELSNLPKEVSQNIASIIFDTMGIYWTMKYANEKDKELLREWDLKPKNLPVKVFVPFGYYDKHVEDGIPVDKPFALDVSEMEPEDWILTFGLDLINPVSVLIERSIIELREEKDSFSIRDMIEKIDKDKRATTENKNAAISLFEAADTWGIFAHDSKKATSVNDLINAGTTSVLDLSVYNAVGAFNVRALVISLVSRKIFNQRMSARKKEEIKAVSRSLEFESGGKKDNPLVWVFIDEAHEFLPKEGKTPATDALVQLLREGRQPGISLVLATQQPGKIHGDVMTQSDLLLSHRVTSQQDVSALGEIMQTYLMKGIKQQMDELPSEKGSAIMLDDTSERIYSMRMRPRFTWHGGEAPIAIKRERGL